MEVQFDEGGAFLTARVKGAFSLQAMLVIVDRIAAEAEARGAQRVLIESLGLTGEIPDIDRYDLGKATAEKLLHVERIAMLRPAHIRFTGLGIDAAQNRGLDIRAFLDRAAAEHWLTTE